MKRKTEIDLLNLAFNWFRDEPAYKSYIKKMEEIFKEDSQSD